MTLTLVLESATIEPAPAVEAFPDVMDIVVSLEHIRLGLPARASHCPIALSSSEHFGLPCSLGFGGQLTVRDAREVRTVARYYSFAAFNWAVEYDNGRPVYPESFRFERIEQWRSRWP